MVTTPFTFVVVLFACIMVISAIVQYHKRHVTFSWAVFWSFLWIIGTAATFFTGGLHKIGNWLIGGDGQFLAMYIAIIFLLFICYRLFLAVQRQNAAISKLVEELAKKKK